VEGIGCALAFKAKPKSQPKNGGNISEMVKDAENCGKNGVEIGFNNPGIEAHQDFTIFHHISPIKKRSTNWRESGFNMI
jgi:hypothetical protein